MTVYRYVGPRGLIQGSIDEVLEAVIHDIEPHLFYWFEGREDLTGLEVIQRLLDLKQQAEPSHTYVQNVAFGRALGGNPGDFRITRKVDGETRKSIS